MFIVLSSAANTRMLAVCLPSVYTSVGVALALRRAIKNVTYIVCMMLVYSVWLDV